jgi:hypothetical protein
MKIEPDSNKSCFFKKLGDGHSPKEGVVLVNFSHGDLSRLHTMNWGWRPWIGSIWSSSEQSDLAQSSSVLHMQSQNGVTYLSTKFKEKPCPAFE